MCNLAGITKVGGWAYMNNNFNLTFIKSQKHSKKHTTSRAAGGAGRSEKQHC